MTKSNRRIVDMATGEPDNRRDRGRKRHKNKYAGKKGKTKPKPSDDISPQVRRHLEAQGYFSFRHIDGNGLCALQRFMFTVGLCCDIDLMGYQNRYCFPSLLEAQSALNEWSGEGHPPGDWIKRKGKDGDLPNPKDKEFIK